MGIGFISFNIYFPAGMGNNTPAAAVCNPHVGAAMPEGWHRYLIIFDGGRRDGGCGCFAGDGGTSLHFISALIYFPADTGNNAHRSRRFANPHAVVAMPEGWHVLFYYIQRRTAGLGM